MRTDIPIAQQAIQAAHAALELGLKHGPSPDGHPSIIFIEAKSQEQLLDAKAYAEASALTTYPFFEPYQAWGLTAFACEPIPQDRRALFAGFTLWRK